MIIAFTSVDRDTELLGGLRACVVRYRLGKRERPCRSGSAADGGPPIGPCGQREAGRQLSRRNRPGAKRLVKYAVPTVAGGGVGLVITSGSG